MTPSKAKRFTEFLNRLRAAPATVSSQEAFELIARTLNAVEDEFSSIPFDPSRWLDDGRMYPAQADSARFDPARPDLVRYRSRMHNTWISVDGAIRIDEVNGPCLLNKPGQNGHSIDLP
jgi:hypothetical protein